MVRRTSPGTVLPTAPLAGPVQRYQAPYRPMPPGLPKESFGLPYWAGAIYLILLFSHATEFIDNTGRLHLVVLTAFIATLAAVAGGKLMADLSSKPGLSLTLLTGFLILSIPFSSWKGNSYHNFMDSWFKSYIAFFLVSSLLFTVNQMKRSFFLLGAGTLGIVFLAFKAAKINDDGRLSVEYGSLGNSNDLAGALLMGLPFVLYVVMDKRRSKLVRLFFVAITGALLLDVFKTGSRSSILVMVLMAAIVFFRTTSANKMKIMALTAVAACVFPIVAGKTLMARYETMFSTSVSSGMSADTASAVESTQARKQLVWNALELTVRHPIFGVGLGNFANQSADLDIAHGRKALWYTSHDIYLLVSSETGLVGIALYGATILFSFGILFRIEKVAKQDPELSEISSLALCLILALVAYAACGLFGTNAYTPQLPMFAGLAVALDRITKPVIAAAEERRMQAFRNSVPVQTRAFARPFSAAPALR